VCFLLWTSQLQLTLQELESKYPDGLPLLDPVEDIGIDDPSMTAAVRKVAALEQRLADNAVHKAAAGSAAR
jgi:ATP-dependent RNA helicase DOB1